MLKKFRKVLIVFVAVILVIVGGFAFWFAQTGTMASAKSLKHWKDEARRQGVILYNSDRPRIPDSVNGASALDKFVKVARDIPFKVSSPKAKLDLTKLSPEVKSAYEQLKPLGVELLRFKQARWYEKEGIYASGLFTYKGTALNLQFLAEHELIRGNRKGAELLIQMMARVAILRTQAEPSSINFFLRLDELGKVFTSLRPYIKKSPNGQQIWQICKESSLPLLAPIDYKQVFQETCSEWFYVIEEEKSKPLSFELVKGLFGEHRDIKSMNFPSVRDATQSDIARALAITTKDMRGTSLADYSKALPRVHAEVLKGCSFTREFRGEIFTHMRANVMDIAQKKLQAILSTPL
jgi:hypothetical protein